MLTSAAVIYLHDLWPVRFLRKLCADSLLHVLKQEDDHGPMIEEEEDDGGSSSEDEIISMCRNNLVQQQN
jgi:hypothetical protein